MRGEKKRVTICSRGNTDFSGVGKSSVWLWEKAIYSFSKLSWPRLLRPHESESAVVTATALDSGRSFGVIFRMFKLSWTLLSSEGPHCSRGHPSFSPRRLGLASQRDVVPMPSDCLGASHFLPVYYFLKIPSAFAFCPRDFIPWKGFVG